MSTKKPADARLWMPLYITDWDADTSHLSCEEDGAYGRLIRFYWRNGPPPDDDGALSRIVRESPAKWKKLRQAVSPFFVIVDGRWTHKRVEAEREHADGMVEKRRTASQTAHEARWGTNAKRNADRMPNASKTHCDGHAPTPSPREEPSQGVTELGGRDVVTGQVVKLRRDGER